jgi:enterochelin esterase-like enzyme
LPTCYNRLQRIFSAGRSTAVLANHLARIVSVFFISISIPSFASETELAVAKTREGVVAAGKPQSYELVLNAGDYAEIKVDPRGKELTLITYDPSGTKCRGAKLGRGEGNFDFIVDRPGKYRLEVASSDNDINGSYAITLKKIVSLRARLAPLKPAYESLRINALRAAVEAGKPGSIDSFWKEVEKEGAPIIEPLPGDDKNMLVTFLWRGTPDTRNVFVARLPYAGGAPDDYFMDRLGDSGVWYKTVAIDRKTRFEYSLAPNVPRIRPVLEGMDNDAIAMIAAAARPDPLNPKRWRVDALSVDSPAYEGRSMVEMPDAPPQPWLAKKPGVPSGQIEKRQFKSALLKNEREIAVYLPPGYSRDAEPYPLLLLFDEIDYLGDSKQIVLVPTPTILDNLISAKRIPAMLALLVGNVPGQRDRELPCNPAFADFLSSELLPWAHGLYNFTTNPRQVVVAGSSFGGLAAACAGLRHSETFGNILSQSGAFHWLPPKGDQASDSGTDSEPNWVARQFIASPKLPLRFYLDAGSEEFDISGDGRSILVTSRTLRDVLLAKGYEVHFQEFVGGHDYLSWRGTLADGLMALMGSPSCSPGHGPAPKP